MQNYSDSVHQRSGGNHGNLHHRKKEYTSLESKGSHICSNCNSWGLHEIKAAEEKSLYL